MLEQSELLKSLTTTKYEISVKCNKSQWKIIETINSPHIFSLAISEEKGYRDIQQIWKFNLQGEREFRCDCKKLDKHKNVLFIYYYFFW